MDRENATEIQFFAGSNIESAVTTLLQARANGENAFIEFNGHKLYSADVTMDSAYLEITGKTKEQSDKDQAEWSKNYEKEYAVAQERAKANIPNWVEKGKPFIFPERHEEWQLCVEGRASDLYHGSDLDASLEIMEALENGASMEEAKALFNKQGHSGASGVMVRNILFSFTNRGPEFWEATAYGEISPESQKAIADKKQENIQLQKAKNQSPPGRA